jgi:hypothetical protein
MSQIKIDKQKAINKWKPVLENMGVAENRVEWMSEMAEFNQINENAYVNNANVMGMGSVLNPVLGTLPGSTTLGGGVNGSGDIGQNLLPVAMKIAGQTIGLDLVAVKPTPGPKIDLLYIDFQYDDVNQSTNERPQVFKLNATNLTTINAQLNLGLTSATTPITQTQGGLSNGRMFVDISTGTMSYTEPTTKTNMVEFLGFSRIDGYPMFRAYRQANTAGQFNYFTFESIWRTKISSNPTL